MERKGAEEGERRNGICTTEGVPSKNPGREAWGVHLGKEDSHPEGRGTTLCLLFSHFLPFVWVCKSHAGRGYICHGVPRA